MEARRDRAAFGRRTLLLGGAATSAAALVSACAEGSAGNGDQPAPAKGKAVAAARPVVRFGLNYTPSKYWWFIWQNWDPGRISTDLGQIAGLGMDHIRAQLIWSVFQPQADQIEPVMLDRLSALLDIADQHHLDVDVSVLTGYLSGQQFIPQWARAGNWVKRPDLIAGQVAFFKAVAERIGQHPRLMGFDTGNELIGHAPSTDFVELGSWSDQLLAPARAAAPNALLTISSGGDFVPRYASLLSTVGDVSVVHPWYFLNATAPDGTLADDPLHHVEYNIEYMKSFHRFSPQEPRRKVWVQEVGAPSVSFLGTASVPAALAPEFATGSYENALACDDLYGITWWCSHDIDTTQNAGRFHPPEPTLGVFDVAGRPKPIATAIASVISRWKRGDIAAPAHRSVGVAGDSAGTAFLQLIHQGIRPAVVPLGLVTDASYLARRGITRIAGQL